MSCSLYRRETGLKQLARFWSVLHYCKSRVTALCSVHNVTLNFVHMSYILFGYILLLESHPSIRTVFFTGTPLIQQWTSYLLYIFILPLECILLPFFSHEILGAGIPSA